MYPRTSRPDSLVANGDANGLIPGKARDAKNAKIAGVPSLVVNGKYRVETGSIKSYDELLDIAYYLAEMNKK